ncbi:MAG: excinuclease ABC subunit UvrC [Cyclobacteriaceae bacterium]|nr:excinuclease ABC subunit UvrC [Cyclobacteriaceae bacterium]
MNRGGLKSYVLRLPEEPGVYRFYNTANQLIYVGKAKNLKKRVLSYFGAKQNLSRKTLRLVHETNRIEYTVAESEFDALLLENNLIKQFQPRYNILLKDDKTYPYLCILRERFPRIISTRKYLPDQGEYFGPYSSVVAMKNVLELIRKLYTIRTCNLPLTESNIKQRKFKICLEYHIGNCKGPCEGLQSEEDYRDDIEHARYILKGNINLVKAVFEKQMQAAANRLDYERAQHYKERLITLEKFQSKSLVVNKALTDIDVITVTGTEKYAYINYLLIKEGAIVYSRSVEIQKKLGEQNEELLSLALVELRQQANSTNTEVLSNLPVLTIANNLNNTVPKIGDKRKLVALSLKNALELKREKELLRAERPSKNNPALEALRYELQLSTLPITIECFDNSNLQGTNPVASMVRFVNGKPDKKNYRHFNIKTVTGPNDFASMKEVVGRRYRKLLNDQSPLPDLILIDGGKGQLSSACEALKEINLHGQVAIAGIAKRLEEIYLPEDSMPLLISKKSPGLKLIQQIRNEAHRFAITFHRQKRSETNLQSSLDDIAGIGKTTIEKLLRHFKSVRKIREASFKELEQIIGKSKAKLVIDANKKAPAG